MRKGPAILQLKAHQILFFFFFFLFYSFIYFQNYSFFPFLEFILFIFILFVFLLFKFLETSCFFFSFNFTFVLKDINFNSISIRQIDFFKIK